MNNKNDTTYSGKQHTIALLSAKYIKKLIKLPFNGLKKFLIWAFNITPFLDMLRQTNHQIQTIPTSQKQLFIQMQASLTQIQNEFKCLHESSIQIQSELKHQLNESLVQTQNELKRQFNESLLQIQNQFKSLNESLQQVQSEQKYQLNESLLQTQNESKRHLNESLIQTQNQFQRQLNESLQQTQSELRYQGNLIELLSKTSVFVTDTVTNFSTKVSSLQQQDWPLITIIMPVWNREGLIRNAIKSIQEQSYNHWELIIIDDGSTDNTKKMIEPYLSDNRVQYYWQQHSGLNVARNVGLANSNGELITYLDSDNRFFPYTLKMIAMAFLADTQCNMAHFGAIWEEAKDHSKRLNFPEDLNMEDQIVYQINDFIRGIDANCFVHRRNLYEKHGGYDPQLSRLTEYELVFRYSQHEKIKALPFIGTHYNVCLADNTVTEQNNLWYNLYLIRKKHSPTKTNWVGLKVLYIMDQMTKSYVYTEIDYMQRHGVSIEVWSQHDSAIPLPSSIKIHTGALHRALIAMQPDLVHSHNINEALPYADETETLNIPMTICGHGFEFSLEILRKLQQHQSVYAIYLFENFYKKAEPHLNKLISMPTYFNSQQYSPTTHLKNRKLVIQVGTILITNELEFFINVAHRCKTTHRFTLVLSHDENPASATYLAQLNDLNQRLGFPVEIHINMMPEEITLLMQQAGIYFHTYLDEQQGGATYGMPVSICEAMATGAYVIDRDAEGSNAYIGNKAHCYSTEDEAVKLISDTAHWTDTQWHFIQQCAIDRAYQFFVDERVLPQILNNWTSIQSSTQANHHPTSPVTQDYDVSG